MIGRDIAPISKSTLRQYTLVHMVLIMYTISGLTQLCERRTDVRVVPDNLARHWIRLAGV